MRKSNRRPKNMELYKGILELRTLDECVRFFDDLCSVTELSAMEQRYQVAGLLYEGAIYNKIMAMTGASSAIISRVNRSINYGADGYAPVFERLREKGEFPPSGFGEEE